ncbi:MAG TPA: crossover junction endodeoxyribonuclease RuvC [Candidatus Acidoferrales bacterium]
MRVLGVDCGTASTGYGIVELAGGRCRMLAYGAIRTSPSWELPQRLQKIHRELKTLAERFAPEAMAIEAVFSAVNVRSALKLAQVRGVALLAAAETGLPVSEYSALEVKRGVVGYGRAEKCQVQRMVRQLLQLEVIPEPDDAADALAVALCHLHTASTHKKIAASVAAEGSPRSNRGSR